MIKDPTDTAFPSRNVNDGLSKREYDEQLVTTTIDVKEEP